MSILPCYDARAPLMQQYCNPKYGRLIKAIGDLQSDVVRYRAVQMLLLVAYVHLKGVSFLPIPHSRMWLNMTRTIRCNITINYRLIAPNDREHYLHGFLRVFLTDSQPFSLIIKVRTKQRQWRRTAQQSWALTHSFPTRALCHMLSRHPMATGRCGSTS